MQIKNLENQTEFLLSAALAKCGNLDEAQDLTQDTLLAALDYFEKGGEIKEMRGWLLTVMNRRFYQNLRKKYKMPTITIGESFDILDEKDYFENIGQTSEAEQVRKAVAYLAKIHREVIIRHYMRGESVQKIADALNIPQGTVKSRLSAGREQLKKELIMDNYEKQSYEPIHLIINNSGRSGINGEPWSLVKDDLIAQNLLYLAYRKPVTELELSKAIGIPMAFIEPIIKKLVDGELMIRVGNKVYTDFMISTMNDKSKYIPAQKQCVEDNQELFFQALKKGLEKVREKEYYMRLNEHQKKALELYFAVDYFDNGIYRTFSEIYNAEQVFKDRPNGGNWIAFGNVMSYDEGLENMPVVSRYPLDILMHGYAGRRWTKFDNYFDSKSVMFFVYDLGFPIRIYHETGGENNIDDEDVLKLLYIVESGTNPEKTGFNTEVLKKIPWLVKCGILKYNSDGKPALDIPIMSLEEWNTNQIILGETSNNLTNDIKDLLTEYFNGKKQEIPEHLTSVPLQKQYLNASNAFVMAAIRLAVKQRILNSWDYDNEVETFEKNGTFPYSMIFVVDK